MPPSNSKLVSLVQLRPIAFTYKNNCLLLFLKADWNCSPLRHKFSCVLSSDLFSRIPHCTLCICRENQSHDNQFCGATFSLLYWMFPCRCCKAQQHHFQTDPCFLDGFSLCELLELSLHKMLCHNSCTRSLLFDCGVSGGLGSWISY